MTHKRALQDRCKSIFKIWVTPYLHTLDFKKTGNTYNRQVGRLLHMLTVELEGARSSEKASFTIRCGVFMPGVMSRMWNTPEPKKIDALSGIIHVRPTLMSAQAQQVWWDLSSTDDESRDDRIGRELAALLESHVMPWFARFQSERALASFLEQPREGDERHIFPYCQSQCLAYAGIIWDQLGEPDKCRECMAKAVELAKGKRLEADIEKFAREYVCGQFPRIAPS